MHLHVQCIFDWEVRRLGMRDTLKHGTIAVSGFGYFHKNFRFLWEIFFSKTNLGSTIHYTYTSYNKHFRLCMVSEELRLNEIGLFLQQYRYLMSSCRSFLMTYECEYAHFSNLHNEESIQFLIIEQSRNKDIQLSCIHVWNTISSEDI